MQRVDDAWQIVLEGKRLYVGGKGEDFAKRLLDERYGPVRPPRGPGTEFNELQKYADRAFE